MNSSETTHNPLDGITATLEKALQQAREQADTIIADARKQADAIINDARTQAETIINDAQADVRAKGDMERASLAIQEHAAALHTLALGLTGHETTPNANNADDNATSGSADDDSAGGSNENTNNADTIPPAPTAATPYSTATTTIRANAPTTRRANGTTRKLAPWEQPQEQQDETDNTPAPEPEETLTTDNTKGNSPAHTSAAQDATTPPTWDAPLIIDAPLQL